ncbi:hypothetical protein GW17_00039340 [Ensete ventricosum]|uniref:Uncharacterized protein n=1 Tax=Ensete ventricosum TaxID=4639 RepID=A0A444DIB2_ENSVE|nr:hypothetical protein B296_00022004 [Ensete ventricosum]RWV97847.1 hypothetical protein GW17_00039340 [Ensete ventricosum]
MTKLSLFRLNPGSIYHGQFTLLIAKVKYPNLILNVQKLLFLGTAEAISTLRPYWLEATRGIADIVQAMPDMLEIVPCGAAKRSGIKLLLDHLGIAADEV